MGGSASTRRSRGSTARSPQRRPTRPRCTTRDTCCALKGNFDAGLPLARARRGARSGQRGIPVNRLGMHPLRRSRDLRAAIRCARACHLRSPRARRGAQQPRAGAARRSGESERALGGGAARPGAPARSAGGAPQLTRWCCSRLGRFAEAWPAYLVAARSAREPARPGGAQFAAARRPRCRRSRRDPSITLHGEQGLGDTLFFLRFAPAARAARGTPALLGRRAPGPDAGALRTRIRVAWHPSSAPRRSIRRGSSGSETCPHLLRVGTAFPPAARLVADAGAPRANGATPRGAGSRAVHRGHLARRAWRAAARRCSRRRSTPALLGAALARLARDIRLRAARTRSPRRCAAWQVGAGRERPRSSPRRTPISMTCSRS